MTDVDFEKIVLTRSERKYLRQLKRRSLPLPSSMQHLYLNDFVSPCYTNECDPFKRPIANGKYELSDTYYRYCEYMKKQRIKTLPNWLAIIIAFGSLIVSIISLVISLR